MYTQNFKRLIGLIFLCSQILVNVKSEGTGGITGLPACYYDGSINTGAVCQRTENVSFVKGEYCIDSTNKKIYETEDSACTDKTPTQDDNLVFECTTGTSGISCKVASAYTGTLLYYDYVNTGTVLTQNKYDYYFDSSKKKLLHCPTTSGQPGACELAGVGFYLLKTGASGNSNVNADQIVEVKSTGAEAASVSSTDGTYYYLDTITSKLIEAVVASNGSSKTFQIQSPLTEGFYVNSGTTDLTNAIISCSGTSCNADIEVKKGDIFLNAGSDNGDKPLIKCDTVCSTAEGDIGYSINAGAVTGAAVTKQLIQCTTDKNCSEVNAPGIGYLPASTATDVIQCTSTSSKCASTTHGATGTTSKHYLEAAASSPGVITCSSTGCVAEDIKIKGYFVNAAGSTTKHVISCNGTGCSEATDATTCSKAGGFRYKDSKVQICISATDADTHVEIKSGATASYNEIKIATAGDFPGASANSDIVVKVDTDGSAYLLEDGGLTACEATCTTEGIYCWDNTNKLVKTKDSSTTSCVAITDTTSTGGDLPVFFKPDGTIDSSSTSTAGSYPNIIGYQCTFEGSGTYSATSCSLIKGFSVDSTNAYQCSGWRKDGCTVTTLSSITNDCAAGNILTIGKDSKVCFGATGVALNTYSTAANAAFIPSELNKDYGVFKGKTTFVTITQNSVLVSTDTAAVKKGYHLNNAVSKNKKNALIKCTTDGDITSCSAVDAGSGYYLNAGDTTTKKVIQCDSTNGCQAIEPGTTGSDAGNIYDSSGIKLYIDASSSPDIKEDTTASAKPTYHTLTLTAAANFPDGKVGNIAVKVGTDGTALLLEDISLPECSAITSSAACETGSVAMTDGQHCINDKKIYKTNSGNCEIISGKSNSSALSYYKDESFEEVAVNDVSSSTSKKLMVYECQFDGDGKASKCTLVRGYTKPGSSFVQCNGWKGEDCELSVTPAASCSANTVDGILGTNELCFSATSKAALSANTEKIAFTGSETSTVYGTLKDDVVILSVSQSQSTVFDPASFTTGTRNFLNYNGSTGSGDEIIECTGTSCDKIDNAKGYYLDSGSEKVETTGEGATAVTTTSYSKLIKCDDADTACVSEPSPKVGYYYDATSYVTPSPRKRNLQKRDDEYSKLITCEEKDGAISCTSIDTVNDGYYLDGSSVQTTGTGATAKTTYSKIIQCTSGKCSDATVATGYYVDGSSLIASAASKRGDAPHTYSKLIHCTVPSGGSGGGTSNPECEPFTSDLKPGYYLTPEAATTLTGALIECTESSGKISCSVKDGVKEKIYINNDDNKIIQCFDVTSPSNAQGCKAVSTGIIGTDALPTYFLNANETATADERIIKCNGTKCELIPGVPNKVYLNGNLLVSSTNDNGESGKPLIICTSAKCETSTSSFSSSNVYYVNDGLISTPTDKLTNAIIECTAANTCSLKKPVPGNDVIFYINANANNDPTNFLIQCTSGGCFPMTTQNESAKAGDKEYYVNGGKTAFADAVIECTLAANTSAKRADNPSFKATCGYFATTAANSIFVNGFDHNLIQCYGTNSCTSFKGVVGSEDEPAYYINGAAGTSVSNYEGILIKCEGERKCNVDKGEKDAIYINSNFKIASTNDNGDDTYRLIICENASSTCALGNASTSGVTYYVNSGKPKPVASKRDNSTTTEQNPYIDAIIKCPATGACLLTGGEEDNVYLNGNSAKDSKHLIICNNSKCEAQAITTTTDVYYANSGFISGDAVQKTLITCGSSGCNAGDVTLDQSVTEVFYINNNYGIENEIQKDMVNYLIKCTSEKCTPYGVKDQEEGDVEHYVNGPGTSVADTVIEVTFAKATNSAKRDSPILAQCKVLDTAATNDIYINTSTKKLIQCRSDKCVAFDGSGTKTIPAYYVNKAPPQNNVASTDGTQEDYTYRLIECTNEKCQMKTPNANDVYLNGNIKSITRGTETIANSGSTDENQIIVCSNGKCTPQSVTVDNGEIYFVNAGEYSVTSKKHVLIQCKSGTPVTCDGYKSELGSAKEIFFKNGNYDFDEKNHRDTLNYLIKCSKEDECSVTYNKNAKEGDVEHYVHGTSDANTKSKNAVIKCTLGASGGDDPERRKREVEETTTPLQAECTLIKDSLNGKESNIYINTSDIKQIIRCVASGCTAENNDSVAGKSSAYYIYDDGDDRFNLVKCTSSNCTIISNEDLSKDGNNKVYLNANYKITADTMYPLIKCGLPTSQDSNDSKLENERKRINDKRDNLNCKLSKSSATATQPEFYVNADLNEKGEDYDGESSTEIIKCTANANTTKTSKRADEKTATLKYTCNTSYKVDLNKNNIFLNADFNETNNPKPLIKCTDKGCLEASAKPENSTLTAPYYYVNTGSVNTEKKLKDTLIECTGVDENIKCDIKEAKSEAIYINANTDQLILCYEDKGCITGSTGATTEGNEYYLNSSDLESGSDVPLTNDLIKCYVNEGEKVCQSEEGYDGKVYINSYNTAQVIYCLTDMGCRAKNSTAEVNRPQYFVNGDTIDFEEDKVNTERRVDTVPVTEGVSSEVDKYPLQHDLIKCKNDGKKVKCSVENGKDGDVYINGNYNTTVVGDIKMGEDANHLIKCSEEEGCIAVASNVESEDLPEYYINSGNEAKVKLNETLITCTKGEETSCEIAGAQAYQVYLNSNEVQESTLPLIICSKSSCTASASAATDTSKGYYLNAGKVNEKTLTYDIIECSKDAAGLDGTTVEKCEIKESVNVGVYLNSNYASNGDENQLIQCSSESGCMGIKSESTNKKMEYFVNAESEDLNNAIIFCSNKKCEKQTPEGVPTYYLGLDKSNNVDGLIECVETEVTQDTTSTTDNEPANNTGATDTPTTVTTKKRSDMVNKCTLRTSINSQGYYLNAGYNKAINQTIVCDSSEGCQTLKVDLGYYINAGNTEKPLIICDKEGTECHEEASKACPTSDINAGDYCLDNNQLKFYPNSNSTGLAASKSDDLYTFATIPSQGFPGIRSDTSTLFKISRYFINRFYQSGVVMIDKNGKLVDSLSSDQNDISLYDCDDTKKICNERPGCTSNTYMFDSENQKAIFCNNGKMEYAQFTGYVVDGNRVTGGSKHPYLIRCENGEKCVSIKPKISTYYENSGYDSSSNSLIQCNNNNCIPVVAEAGYYVGRGDSGVSGIIKCTSSSACTYSQVKSKVKYVNSGANKTNYGIIDCSKEKGCSASKAKAGYYLTYTSTILIQCTSPTSCAEFTPTVNYYDNADSSESKNTIINCVQNSNVVTCAAEATNNGFYMSSSPNVLIRCKSGSKCRTITVKNGIFRGALKGLTSGNKRSNEVEADKVESVPRDFDDEEEEGKMVKFRDADDAYGIIRCVAGKCTALSASELAAIPICEFNNNKCYITLEYAMTKSATTSIAAGNICTNGDRSVFYFATDTIVVKPNVIAGVTATYVYTTTNSNCLEVNDSYTDMYFTVGSNIYLLDQGSVLQFYETGYYFINTAKNMLVGGNDIDAYNDENVKLYRCNGSSCSITDKPDSMTYYADVNKRILKYNVNSDAYTFAYEKDIICIFANNKCTPNADLKNQEFCITYKGELVLAKQDIKNRETGECYRAGSISSTIYGYSQYLYQMNQFAAQMVDQTGYYIISLSTNTTVVSKNYKTKNNSLVVYGCTLSSCKVYEPEEDTYYYDGQAKTILRYKDGVWTSPQTSGYAYISIDPQNTYIYKFTKNQDEIKIQGLANYGYYYTVDQEMYHCSQNEDEGCTPIDETGYYFTNSGEIYYCVHDSEELEATECTKQACISGQYYYIDDAYYRCELSSLLTPVVSRYCSYDDNVVVNFPLALTEEYPDKIKQAVEGIQKNNNSTAIVSRRGKNYLESVSGIFTNCTYNVEETKSTFDLVCVNNYVAVDTETDEIKICSIEQLGYVECIEDENNPEKCHVSAGILIRPSILFMIIISIMTILHHIL